MQRKKFKNLLLVLLVFACAGYIRERFFEHLNIIMTGVYRGTDLYAIIGHKRPAIMSMFASWSYAQLYYSKYIFTVVWMLIFYLISYIALKKITGSAFFLRILTWTYGLLFLIAACSMVIGYFVTGSLQNDEYTVSRWLLGITQSPIICLILLAASKLYNQSFNQEK
jgi:hypothetical protein